MQKVVIASSNAGKISEFQRLLAPVKWYIIPQSELNISSIEETGKTFIENVILKARHAASISGLPAIADDSGLTVPYLNNEPGLYSARYAMPNPYDHANRQKLLEKLKNVPFEQRKATFHCFLAYLKHADDPIPLICHGTWHGYITEQEQGEHGFGYDSIFFVPEKKCTAAMLTPNEKNAISHRAKALKQLLEQLREA